MSGRRRQGRDFLLGVIAGGIAIALLWHFDPGSWRGDRSDVLDAAWQRRQALQQGAEQQQARSPGPVVQAAVVQDGARGCGFSPLLRPASQDDGRFSLTTAPGSGQGATAPPFLTVARESAAQGRARDAEVAYIAACRIQSRERGASLPLADIEATLADHYAAAAAGEAAADSKSEILLRSARLLSDSVRTYGNVLGDASSKTRTAQERLAGVNAMLSADAGTGFFTPALPEEAQLLEASSSPPVLQDDAQMAALSPSPADPGQRESADAMVRDDAELAQLDVDLGRLRAQAQSVAADPAALQRRIARARAQRDACADRACLLQWYARRRTELLASF